MIDDKTEGVSVFTHSLTPFVGPEKSKADKDTYNYSCECEMRVDGPIVQLNYQVKGDIKSLEFEESQASGERKIGLWERTCFEFFIKMKGKSEYFEFNFAPSGDWNCFHFSNRDQELNEFPGIKRIPIASQLKQSPNQEANEFHLTALLNIKHLGSYFYYPGQMQAGITAVILNQNKGKRDYWALKHLQKKPNFHDFNTFIANF